MVRTTLIITIPPIDCATGACEDSGEVSLWEDNWDDDIVEEEFSSLLR